MGSGTFNVGGTFSGRDGNLYGQTATLRFTTLSGSLNLSNQQQDTGPYLEVASGARCTYIFSGQRDVKGFDCAGEFVNTTNGNSLDVYGNITIRSTGIINNTGTSFYVTTRTASSVSVTLEAGADVGNVFFGSYRANPSTPQSLTFSGAGWATATGATLDLNYQTAVSGRYTYVFPANMHVYEVMIRPRYSSSKTTLDFSTNSTQLTVQKHFRDISSFGVDAYNINVGASTLTFTLAENSTFSPRGNTFPPIIIDDGALWTLTLDSNVTTPYLHDCADQVDENGYTVTTTGTDPNPCATGARYWVGYVDSDFENTGNWSTSSGGLGNASVPVATNDIYFDGNGAVNCTLSKSRSVGGFDVDTAYGSTFNMNGYNFRIAGDCDLGSDSSGTVGITFQKGNGTLLFAGTTNLNFARALWGGSGSTVEWTGTHTLLTFFNGGNVPGTQNITGGSLTINPWIANNWQYIWQTGTINGTLTANNNIQFMGSGSLDVSISNNATVAGTARVTFRGNSNCDLRLGSNVTFSIATVEFECYRLTLHGDFVADNDVLIDRWTTTSDQFTFAGNNVFSVGGNLTVSSTQGGSWNHTSKNVFYTIKGDVVYSGSMTWNAGNGSITFDNTSAQSVDFNGETIEAVIVSDLSTSTITLGANFTTPYVHDCNNLIDLNGFTITETGTDPSPCVSSGATRSLINGFTSPLISGGLVQ
jgi:hypothetical protein